MTQRRLALFAAALLIPACSSGDTDPDLPPPAPTGLAAQGLGAQSVQLSWTDPTPDEDGFHIWYRLAGIGNFVLLKTVGVNATSDLVNGLAPLTDYEFQVTAFNQRGDSQASNTAAASTGGLGWTQLPDAPLGLQYVQSAYDSLQNRMIVFGGADEFTAFTDDLIALDLDDATPSAVPIVPANAVRPGPRLFPTLIYDSRRLSLILFGGVLMSTAVPQNDVWEFDLTAPGASNPDGMTWTQLSPGGTAPPARYRHSAIYDPVNGRMVVFGGFDDAFELDDVARLLLPSSGTPTWESLTLSGTPPQARDNHSAIYDALNQRMIVFGGYDGLGTGAGPLVNDLWSLPLSASPVIAWSLLASAGSVPPPRDGQMAVYDSVNRRMVVFGGREEVAFLPENRVWTLDLDGLLIWTELSPLAPSPAARTEGTAVFDPGRVRMVLWGGTGFLGLPDIEVWALGL